MRNILLMQINAHFRAYICAFSASAWPSLVLIQLLEYSMPSPSAPPTIATQRTTTTTTRRVTVHLNFVRLSCNRLSNSASVWGFCTSAFCSSGTAAVQNQLVGNWMYQQWVVNSLLNPFTIIITIIIVISIKTITIIILIIIVSTVESIDNILPLAFEQLAVTKG